MKPLTLVELESICKHLQELLGAQVQDILANEKSLVLCLFKGRLSYLIFDLSMNCPWIAHFQDLSFWKKSVKPKPLQLFMRAHAENLRIQKIEIIKDQGRVLQILLSSAAETSRFCQLQFQMIPKQSNLLVTAWEQAAESTSATVSQRRQRQSAKDKPKSMAWSKPRPLAHVPEILDESPPRSWPQLQEEWLHGSQKSKAASLDPQAQWEKNKESQLQKKRKAQAEIEKQLGEDLAEKWQQLGELLKYTRLQDLQSEWSTWLDKKLSQSQNRERAFHKAKQIQQKKVGHLQRLEILQKEIHGLENSKYQHTDILPLRSQKDLMQKTETSGRKKKLESGAVAYLGKTAQDNLKILRAAHPWDLWLHLRDYPGAHAVIHIDKGQSIPESEIRHVALWVAQQSLSQKVLALGQKLEVIIAECRFVRPIKGDKQGRVHYQSERNIIVTYPSLT